MTILTCQVRIETIHVKCNTYLLVCWKMRIMEATVDRLKLGCTLSPASLSERPWLITWSMIVARISSLTTVLAALGMPPPCILTPLPCPLLGPALLPGSAPLTAPAPLTASLTGPALLPGPLALTLPRPDITVFVFFCFCFQKHHSSKSSFYCISVNVIEKITPATESKPDWNQLWLAQFTQHKSAVCQLFNVFLLSAEIYLILILFLNWYHCRSRCFYTVSKVWNIVFAIVGCCVLTFVNTTKTIHNFVGRYSLSVKKM